jgi:hypothetical protein
LWEPPRTWFAPRAVTRDKTSVSRLHLLERPLTRKKLPQDRAGSPFPAGKAGVGGLDKEGSCLNAH